VADVIIERCTVRAIRRGGWSWGASRDAIVEVARRALPQLLARRLETLWEDNVEGEIVRPQRVSLRISVGELAAIIAEQRRGTLTVLDVDDATVAAVDAALAQQLSTVVARVVAPRRLPNVVAPSTSPTDVEGARMPAPARVTDLIRRWHRSHVLEVRLRGLKTAALRVWLRLLSSEEDRTAADNLAAAPARDETLEARPPLQTQGVAERFVGPGNGAILSDEHAELIGRAIAWAERDAHANPAAITAAPIERERRQLPPSPSLPTEGRALPFLLLPPLAQIGFLDVMAASFAAVARSDDMAAFAVALALKVLPPPERGWRRRADEVASAAAVAALDAIPDLTALADYGDEALWSPLAVALAQPVLEAHTEGQPFFAIPVGGADVLVVDGEGAFPVACAPAEEIPALLWGAAGPLGLPRALATPTLLAALDVGGIAFFTDAPPARGEHWNAVVVGAGERVWTNTFVDHPLTAAWHGLLLATVEVPPLWRALTVERPVAPSSRTHRLDAILAQAAMLGLAFIAWALWRRHGPAHPSLALSRFSDLDARLAFSDAAIDVVLPLGRRSQDLRAHRLLSDVAPPWLHPRTVRFRGA
jgi:hypothetical protein